MSDIHSTFTFSPIGVAHTPFQMKEKGRTGIPAQGAPAEIEIFPEFTAGLEGIEGASHIIVLGFFDRADRSLLQVRPRKCMPDAPMRGVFAIRAPTRPNPIGLTVTPLIERKDNILKVHRLDFLDQTPIVDIKPYEPGWDQMLWATHMRRTKLSAMTDESLITYYDRSAEDAIRTPGELGKNIRNALINLVHQEIDPRNASVRYAVPVLDERVDLLTVMTGATFGNGRLVYNPAAQVPCEILL